MPRILSRLVAPPPALLGGSASATTMPQLFHDGENEPPSSPSSSSAITAITIVASVIVLSSSIYLLLRCLTRHRIRTFSAVDDDVLPPSDSINSHRDSRRDFCSADSHLPLFTFNLVTGKNLANGGGDCAVCLSKFEADDILRLLPLCCHAFHAQCIDAWLSSNQTCPLCRSTVHPTESDVLDKILSSGETATNSFRVEIGSVSRRRRSEIDCPGESQRSYSIGAFDYIVDAGYEVSAGSTTHRRGISDDKESIGNSVESLAGEVSSGRSWLRDYVDRFSSGTVSFRSDVVVAGGAVDLEANGMGEDISEFFRWFSGV